MLDIQYFSISRSRSMSDLSNRCKYSLRSCGCLSGHRCLSSDLGFGGRGWLGGGSSGSGGRGGGVGGQLLGGVGVLEVVAAVLVLVVSALYIGDEVHNKRERLWY